MPLAGCRSQAGGARATARMASRGSITVFLFTLGNSADKLAGLEQGKSQDAIRRIARSFYRDPIPLQLIEHLTQEGAAAVQSTTQREVCHGYI